MTYPVRRVGGFTLIEVMIALVLTGLLSVLILDFVLGQATFGERQAAHQDAQQSARGSMEILGSELRAVPPGSIETWPLEESAITFRTARAWGVLCAEMPASGTVDVAFAAGTFPGSYQNDSDRWGLDVPLGGGLREGVPATAEIRTIDQHDCEEAAPVGIGADPGGVQVYRFTFSGATGGIAANTAVAVFERVTYSNASPAIATPGITGTWLRRNSQPLAGPLDTTRADNGFRLRHLGEGATAPAAVQDIRKIIVTVAAASRTKPNGGKAVTETDSMLVYLRNQ